LSTELGDAHANALLTTLRDVKAGKNKGFKMANEINLLKCYIKDEGIGYLCDYLNLNKSIKTVNIAANLFGALAMNKMGQILHPKV